MGVVTLYKGIIQIIVVLVDIFGDLEFADCANDVTHPSNASQAIANHQFMIIIVMTSIMKIMMKIMKIMKIMKMIFALALICAVSAGGRTRSHLDWLKSSSRPKSRTHFPFFANCICHFSFFANPFCAFILKIFSAFVFVLLYFVSYPISASEMKLFVSTDAVCLQIYQRKD